MFSFFFHADDADNVSYWLQKSSRIRSRKEAFRRLSGAGNYRETPAAAGAQYYAIVSSTVPVDMGMACFAKSSVPVMSRWF